MADGEGNLNQVIAGPGGERVWTDKHDAVKVSFRRVPYPGGYPGDPLDGKPTTCMCVEIDETKQPAYEVRIPVYDGGPIAPKAMAYVMRDSIPESGLQPREFDLTCRIIAADMADALAEFGDREELKDIFAPMLLPQIISAEQLNRVRAAMDKSGGSDS